MIYERLKPGSRFLASCRRFAALAILALLLASIHSPAPCEEEFNWKQGHFTAEDAARMFGTQAEEITLDEARAYMLELVNGARASEGMQQLGHNALAETVAQKHADDMAIYAYLSHWNTQGATPIMRYTLEGGTHGVTENVTLFSGNARIYLTRKVVEFMHGQFMHSEGHRENLMSPEHTGIGVGIGFAVFADGTSVFTCDQTFIAEYATLAEMPKSVQLGTPVKISGTIDVSRAEFAFIGLGWSPFPQPLTREILNANLQAGATPGNYNAFFAPGTSPASSGIPIAEIVELDENTGRFSATLDLSKPLEGTPMPESGGGPGTQGVYYVFIWAQLSPELIPAGHSRRENYLFTAACWTLGGV